MAAAYRHHSTAMQGPSAPQPQQRGTPILRQWPSWPPTAPECPLHGTSGRRPSPNWALTFTLARGMGDTPNTKPTTVQALVRADLGSDQATHAALWHGGGYLCVCAEQWGRHVW